MRNRDFQLRRIGPKQETAAARPDIALPCSAGGIGRTTSCFWFDRYS